MASPHNGSRATSLLNHHNLRLTRVEQDVGEIKQAVKGITDSVQSLTAAIERDKGSQGRIPFSILSAAVTFFLAAITLASSLVLWVAQASIQPVSDRLEFTISDFRSAHSDMNADIERAEGRLDGRLKTVEDRMWLQSTDDRNKGPGN